MDLLFNQHLDKLQKYVPAQKVRDTLALSKYFYAAEQLWLQCEQYVIEKEHDRAYIFLKRFAQLYLEVLCKHKDRKRPEFADKYKWAKLRALDAISNLKDVREAIRERIEAPPVVEPSAPPSYASCGDPPLYPSSTAAVLASAPSAPEYSAPRPVVTSIPKLPDEPSSGAVSYGSVHRPTWHTGEEKTLFSKSVASSVPPPPPSTQAPSVVDPVSSAEYLRQCQLLRKIEVPYEILSAFWRVAEPNSQLPPHGIETCGIIAGKLSGSVLKVSHCVVPKQTGDANSCTMTNEEELFMYCMEKDLIVCGWIHTHPSQSCFMSSMDVHTHVGIQMLLPEAIAIVIAPRDRSKQWGMFRLTDPPGLDCIKTCTRRGFHEHPGVALYQDASHAQFLTGGSFEMVDLRLR